MQQVLITGAGGFIGRHLVTDQLRRGRLVTAIDLDVDALQPLAGHPGLRLVRGDFCDANLVQDYVAGQDVCFHLASAHLETGVDEDYFWRINVRGTHDFVNQCHSAGIRRFVHCSSVGVFGDIRQPPADESSPCHPDIPYERSKLAGETAALAFARENDYALTVLRPAWVYGPGCPRTKKLFRAVEKGRFFFVGKGETLRHAIYIEDMVRAFEVAAIHDAAPHQVFIIAGPRAVTLRELVGEIACCLGVAMPRWRLPKAMVWPACYLLELLFQAIGHEAPYTRRSLKFHANNTAFSTKKAESMLGFRPRVELDAGLLKTHRSLYASGQPIESREELESIEG